MDGITVACSYKIIKEREHEDGIRWFKRSSFHLNIYLLSQSGCFAGYMAIALWGLLLEVIVVEDLGGGKTSIHRPENVHCSRSFIIFPLRSYLSVGMSLASNQMKTWSDGVKKVSSSSLSCRL